MYNRAGAAYGAGNLNVQDYPTWEIGHFKIQVIRSLPPWKANCYLLHHLPSGDLALIDPGDDAETIIQAVLAQGGKLCNIWLTHAHHDHVGAVAAICHRFSIFCVLHHADVRLLRHAPMYAARFANKSIEAPEQFRSFETEAEFYLGGVPVTVLHVPGHTAGSVCYAMEGFVFTGDTLLFERVGRTDLPGGNRKLLKISIEAIMNGFADNIVLFPGHGRTWNITEARQWRQMVIEALPEFDFFEIE